MAPTTVIEIPERKATYTEHRQKVLEYLKFQKFDEIKKECFEDWLHEQANIGLLPKSLFQKAESYLLNNNILLPAPSVLERMIIRICSKVHENIFESIFQRLSPEFRQTIDQLLTVPEGKQRSYFYYLKESPPAATISSIQNYLKKLQTINETGINRIDTQIITPALLDYFFKQAKRYNATEIKRFTKQKRYSVMLCFLLETRKVLLDHIALMHEQYVIDMCRKAKNIHEKSHRSLRKFQKKAIDIVLETTEVLFDWPEEQKVSKKELWEKIDAAQLRNSVKALKAFKQLEERGYGDLLLNRYPSLRKYFSEFIKLKFAARHGSENLIKAIEIVQKLDSGELKKLPKTAPTNFICKELYRVLKDQKGNLNRNAWEMGLALAIKDALRSGNLYLPESKHYVSFWDLTLSETDWEEIKKSPPPEVQFSSKNEVKTTLSEHFYESIKLSEKRFKQDDFAEIYKGKLKLKRYDKMDLSPSVTKLQKVIEAHLPLVRIEQLLVEVDRVTNFSRHFKPLTENRSRPPHFYRTLMAVLISQATNLGVVSMSFSMEETTVDMLRYVLNNYIREETLIAANSEIVNQHHKLPLSAVYGTGTVSSSDAQRFGIRASSLLASYYPRYYGYYEKAIGIYTHVSDQYSVFSTKVISCGPREALYVLDGLLENNTILKIREHTTDTHGYTEIIFALCYLLGFYFMPRIRDLKDQQLYCIDKNVACNTFSPLLTKTVSLEIIEEQWEEMLRVTISLRKRTSPAHVIVRRLTNNFPSDRLSKAFTNLGRLIKTQYILRYITDLDLRRAVQLQLNKGEYRHKLPRRIFFADQGEFMTGDYEEIMNKASCLSLVSNAILYWNTVKISEIVESFRQQGQKIEKETLSHVSLLPFKHVVPNGKYFIDDVS